MVVDHLHSRQQSRKCICFGRQVVDLRVLIVVMSPVVSGRTEVAASGVTGIMMK